MRGGDVFLLVVLAAIWGSSFIFMRILAPVLGPIPTATARTLVAGVFLVILFALFGIPMQWRKNYRHYLVVGLANSGIPFMLYSFAALRLPASIPAAVNALTPLWGAVFAALILKERFTLRRLAGLSLGMAGVAVIALGKSSASADPDPLGVAACILATACYGFSGAYVKRWASDVPSRPLTAAGLATAGLAMLPLALMVPHPPSPIGAAIWTTAVVFSLLCSAVAYLIYYRLIVSSGVTFALSVTLLVPVFAFLWGFVFLGESVTVRAMLGAALVLAGTGLAITKGGRRTA